MKQLALILVAAGAWTCALSAADFWQTKKFTEWNQKEVEKMLKDSPWARTIRIESGAKGGGRSAGGGKQSGMGGGGGRGGASMGGGRNNPNMGAPGSIPGGIGSDAPQQVQTVSTASVRWLTALPIKQAGVRARYGDEAATSPDAVRELERQETQYVVAFVGIPSRMVRNPNALKKNALLKVKGQDPIQAEEAKADLKDNGVTVVLYFPRAGHELTADSGDLELSLKLGSKTITQKFKLKSMVYGGKLEI